MRIDTIPAAELTDEQIGQWSHLQRTDPALDSPYFRPEFSQAVAAVRRDVEVAVLEDAGGMAGFFPFQRGPRGVGMPVGGRLSDFHGAIVRPDAEWSCAELLRGCKLSAWHFDHLPAAQQTFQPYHWHTAGSPYLDLSRGWEGYEEEQRREHGASYKQIARKFRQAEHEAGEIRFEYRTSDPWAFEAMVQWKRGQYRTTGVTDVLSFDWTVALLRGILERRSESFAGVLSALYIGDVLAAVLLSMRSHDVLHAWFSAYSPLHAEFSPGLLLLIELAKAADAEGFRRVDLGKGPEDYKRHFMSGEIMLAEGSIDARPIARMLRRHWDKAYRWLRNSPLKKPLLGPGRFVRRLIEKKKMEA